jgi:hypothetical protein
MIRFVPLVAVALALVPVAASAQTTTSRSYCGHGRNDTYECRYEYNGIRSTVTTRCTSGGGNTSCETERKPKDPYATRIDDGHGPR